MREAISGLAVGPAAQEVRVPSDEGGRRVLPAPNMAAGRGWEVGGWLRHELDLHLDLSRRVLCACEYKYKSSFIGGALYLVAKTETRRIP